MAGQVAGAGACFWCWWTSGDQPARFVDLVASAEEEEVQQYVANLLAALEHIHRWSLLLLAMKFMV